MIGFTEQSIVESSTSRQMTNLPIQINISLCLVKSAVFNPILCYPREVAIHIQPFLSIIRDSSQSFSNLKDSILIDWVTALVDNGIITTDGNHSLDDYIKAANEIVRTIVFRNTQNTTVGSNLLVGDLFDSNSLSHTLSLLAIVQTSTQQFSKTAKKMFLDLTKAGEVNSEILEANQLMTLIPDETIRMKRYRYSDVDYASKDNIKHQKVQQKSDISIPLIAPDFSAVEANKPIQKVDDSVNKTPLKKKQKVKASTSESAKKNKSNNPAKTSAVNTQNNNTVVQKAAEQVPSTPKVKKPRTKKTDKLESFSAKKDVSNKEINDKKVPNTEASKNEISSKEVNTEKDVTRKVAKKDAAKKDAAKKDAAKKDAAKKDAAKKDAAKKDAAKKDATEEDLVSNVSETLVINKNITESTSTDKVTSKVDETNSVEIADPAKKVATSVRKPRPSRATVEFCPEDGHILTPAEKRRATIAKKKAAETSSTDKPSVPEVVLKKSENTQESATKENLVDSAKPVEKVTGKIIPEKPVSESRHAQKEYSSTANEDKASEPDSKRKNIEKPKPISPSKTSVSATKVDKKLDNLTLADLTNDINVDNSNASRSNNVMDKIISEEPAENKENGVESAPKKDPLPTPSNTVETSPQNSPVVKPVKKPLTVAPLNIPTKISTNKSSSSYTPISVLAERSKFVRSVGIKQDQESKIKSKEVSNPLLDNDEDSSESETEDDSDSDSESESSDSNSDSDNDTHKNTSNSKFAIQFAGQEKSKKKKKKKSTSKLSSLIF